MLIADGLYLFHLSRGAIKVSYNNQSDIRIKLERFSKGLRAHIPCVIFRVNKYRFTVFVSHRIDGSIEGHI